MSAGRILVVDDEPQIRRVMKSALTSNGYEVTEAKSGIEAFERLNSEKADLILLDIDMPGMTGLEVCRSIRANSDVFIIMLTVHTGEREKVAALDAGADDYVTKPFSMPELLARVRAALRRAVPDSGPKRLLLEGVEIDFQARSASVNGRHVRLTPKEFDLLHYLVTHPNKAVSHRELLQSVWGPDYGDELEYLRVFINQLRRKIEPEPSKPRYLLTEPWVGYRFQMPEDITKS